MLSRENRTVVRRLCLLAVGMFGFGFALVPLYDVFCEVMGIRSDDIRSAASASAIEAGVDTSRIVRVQFLANNDGTMPWEFRPGEFDVRLHPGDRPVSMAVVANRLELIGELVENPGTPPPPIVGDEDTTF